MKKVAFIFVILFTVIACNTTTKTAQTENSISTDLVWYASSNLDDIQKQSINESKPIFIDLSASWCGYCKKMKKNVYTEKTVGAALNGNYIPVSLDGEIGDGKKLYANLKAQGFPTQVIMDADGNVLKQNTGYLNEEQLLAFIAK